MENTRKLILARAKFGLVPWTWVDAKSENVLFDTARKLEKAGYLVSLDEAHNGYPWTRFRITDLGRALLRML